MSAQQLITAAYITGLIDSYQMHLLCAAVGNEPEDPQEFFKEAMKKEPRERYGI